LVVFLNSSVLIGSSLQQTVQAPHCRLLEIAGS
jgi:hypothetical protein